MRRRPWKRLARLRAGRRRQAEGRGEHRPDELAPLPPLVCPDDDREFLPLPAQVDAAPPSLA